MTLSAMMLLLLLSFTNLYSTRAERVYLLNTLNATSELNWRTWSNQDEKDGWLEETMYSKPENVNHQVYSTCNSDHDADVENWLLMPQLDRAESQLLYLDFEFTIMKCSAVPGIRSSCRETLKLYAVHLSAREKLPRHWHNETNWQYVDTLVSSSDASEAETNTQTISHAVDRQFIHFALRNTGACSSILSVKIYYNACAERTANFLSLPRTVTGREAHSVVSVPGRCVPNAVPVTSASHQRGSRHSSSQQQQMQLLAPTAICKADGDWEVLGQTQCECAPGFIPSLKTGLCTACGVGTYKPAHGSGECLTCPEHSASFNVGSAECKCEAGFHRKSSSNAAAGVHAPCTRKDSTAALSRIETRISNEATDEDYGIAANAERVDSSARRRTPEASGGATLATDRGGDGLLQQFSAWPWVIVCVVVVLSLCLVLVVISRHNSASRKQMSDLDVLDNYKQDTISPDYSRSLGGGIVLPGHPPNSAGGSNCGGGSAALMASLPPSGSSNTALRRKLQVPLIPASYGTHRSANHGLLLNATNATAGGTPLAPKRSRYKMYVDPTTYEDPGEALAEFTNEIHPDAVEVTRIIGAGEFGEVCCGRLTIEDAYGQKQQQIVAVKTLLPGSSAKAKADFLTEASIMGQFEHENVIHLIGVATRSEPVMILTEYMLNGSLDQFLRQNDNGRLTMYQLVKLLQGVASGMKYLNDKGYVHRDLAARNVLVDDRLCCKIADFGLSRGLRSSCSIAGEQEYTTQQGGKIPIRWTAPEAITHHKYTAASDVWSFGVVVWEVCSFGERPYWDWTNHKVIEEVVHNNFRLPCPMDAPAQLHQMMLDCWQADRHRRPTFAQLLQQLNAFLAELDYFYKYV